MPVSRRWLPIAAGVLVLLSLIASPGPSLGQRADCPGTPSMLSPRGGPGSRFTMLLRVNKAENVATYGALQAAHGQIRTRDIFVVNTRFGGHSPEKADEILGELGASFPCNRIIALNGLGADPGRPGYALSLVDSPRTWAVLLDWERRDWGRARATNPKMSRWKRHPGRSINRLGSWIGRVTGQVEATPSRVRKVGAVPSFFRDWHYGRIARMLDRRNRRLGHRRGAIQVVATQGSCRKHRGRAKGMGHLARRLLRQYGTTKRKLRGLAVQISFSDHARAKRYLPIRSVNEGRAAGCLRQALRSGAGAVLFWASPESMRALFQNHRFRKLRPRR
jgi:hypothetical protein